jgi:hypothetical protein
MREIVIAALSTAVAVYALPLRAEGSAPSSSPTSSPATSAPSAKRVQELSSETHSAIDELQMEPSTPLVGAVPRAPAGGATMRMQLVMPNAFGTWTRLPLGVDPISVPIVGGEVGLTSHVSLVLEGGVDPVDRRFSGMESGLRLHLFPMESPLQVALTGGLTRPFPTLYNPRRGFDEPMRFFGQMNVAYDAGRLHLGGALRTSSPASDLATQFLLSGNVGAAVDVTRRVRVGFDYAFERSMMTTHSALMPWVALSDAIGRFALRASAAVPMESNTPLTVMLSLVTTF